MPTRRPGGSQVAVALKVPVDGVGAVWVEASFVVLELLGGEGRLSLATGSGPGGRFGPCGQGQPARPVDDLVGGAVGAADLVGAGRQERDGEPVDGVELVVELLGCLAAQPLLGLLEGASFRRG